ncbi:MAG: ATP-binding protein [Armatimonadetes bacterium]|nr:ATP-binding protein [Armatimonadota bacterium]
MFDSVTIKNFRGFESVVADGLGLVNVIVGDNAVGKTTFLEALYLLSSQSPEKVFSIRAWRDMDPNLSSETFESGEIWEDVFYRFREDVDIFIDGKGSHNRSLRIGRLRERAVSLVEGVHYANIMFTWTVADGKEYECIPEKHDKQIRFPNLPPDAVSGALLTANILTQNLADQFSKLDAANEAGDLIRMICEHWEDVQDLKILTKGEGKGTLCASLKSLDRKVPLGLASYGLNRLLYVLVTIASFPDGVVYIDEIDTGLYYERLPDVWGLIYKLASSTRTQIFATTHSGDAVDALLPVIRDHEADFRLLRITKELDTPTIHVVKGKALAAAIASHGEVR